MIIVSEKSKKHELAVIIETACFACNSNIDWKQIKPRISRIDRGYITFNVRDTMIIFYPRHTEEVEFIVNNIISYINNNLNTDIDCVINVTDISIYGT